ncbi:hypothetical protein AX768_23360 [Burkholderia sp. PAMC 28687]|jgi:hypothetical protein|nr:hypothetical protein AX768_23360 [Burkholderia sp. PAMC 28687]
MPTIQVIELQMTAFSEVLAECTELKDRVETERVAVSAITAALVSASETLVERGWMTAKKVHGLTVSMEESALDLRAALDEVDASITTAIAPVEVFAQATERMRIAQSQDAVVDVPGAPSRALLDIVAAQYSALCEKLLRNVRELATMAAVRLDDLRQKIDLLQSSFGEITAAMATPEFRQGAPAHLVMHH